IGGVIASALAVPRTGAATSFPSAGLMHAGLAFFVDPGGAGGRLFPVTCYRGAGASWARPLSHAPRCSGLDCRPPCARTAPPTGQPPPDAGLPLLDIVLPAAAGAADEEVASPY